MALRMHDMIFVPLIANPTVFSLVSYVKSYKATQNTYHGIKCLYMFSCKISDYAAANDSLILLPGCLAHCYSTNTSTKRPRHHKYIRYSNNQVIIRSEALQDAQGFE